MSESSIENSDASTKGWFFYLNASNQPTIAVAPGFATTTTGGSVTAAGSWKSVGFTITNGTQAVYVKIGSSVATGTQLYTGGTEAAGPILGGYNSSTFLLNGKQGLMLSYNRVITSTEIAQVALRQANEITHLSGYTPVVTTVSVSPSSFTVAPSATSQLTATVYDQNGVAMPGETVTWDTSNHSFATVNSSGLVSGVANGSVTVTATSVTDGTKTGTSAGTISNSSVSSVTVYYNSAIANGLFMRTGNNYTLVAKDQSGQRTRLARSEHENGVRATRLTHRSIPSSGVVSPECRTHRCDVHVHAYCVRTHRHGIGYGRARTTRHSWRKPSRMRTIPRCVTPSVAR